MPFAFAKPIRRAAARTGWCGRALADTSGASAVIYGLMLPGLLGMAGLAVDAVSWQTAQHRQQAATDQAAISGAQMLYRNADAASIASAVRAHLARLYGDDYGKLMIAVHNPPLRGAAAGDSRAIEVEVSQPQPLYFSRVLHVDEVRVSTRAVSRYRPAEEFCLLALADKEDGAVTMSGSSQVSLGCGIASNSEASTAIYISGSTTVTVPSVSAVGDILVKDSATLNAGDRPLQPFSLPIDDPYGPAGRNLQVPQFPTGCTQRNAKIGKDTSLSPGRYCGGIHFTGGTITLAPGTYIMDGGDLRATGNVSIAGAGVTIVLTGSGSKYAQLDIGGGASLALSAPTDDPMFKGVLMFQDPQATSRNCGKAGVNKLNGNDNMQLSGALYFPAQELDFSGASNGATACLQLVARQVTVTGNARINNVCDPSTGAEKIERSQIRLVE